MCGIPAAYDMRYGSTGHGRETTAYFRHSKVRANIESRFAKLAELKYKFTRNEEMKTLVHLINDVHAFDRQEQFILAQLSNECIQFAKQTVMHMTIPNSS
jgi:hypothetical protein